MNAFSDLQESHESLDPGLDRHVILNEENIYNLRA